MSTAYEVKNSYCGMNAMSCRLFVDYYKLVKKEKGNQAKVLFLTSSSDEDIIERGEEVLNHEMGRRNLSVHWDKKADCVLEVEADCEITSFGRFTYRKNPQRIFFDRRSEICLGSGIGDHRQT